MNDLTELLDATPQIDAQTRHAARGPTPVGAARRVSLHDPDACTTPTTTPIAKAGSANLSSSALCAGVRRRHRPRPRRPGSAWFEFWRASAIGARGCPGWDRSRIVTLEASKDLARARSPRPQPQQDQQLRRLASVSAKPGCAGCCVRRTARSPHGPTGARVTSPGRPDAGNGLFVPEVGAGVTRR